MCTGFKSSSPLGNRLLASAKQSSPSWLLTCCFLVRRSNPAAFLIISNTQHLGSADDNFYHPQMCLTIQRITALIKIKITSGKEQSYQSYWSYWHVELQPTCPSIAWMVIRHTYLCSYLCCEIPKKKEKTIFMNIVTTSSSLFIRKQLFPPSNYMHVGYESLLPNKIENKGRDSGIWHLTTKRLLLADFW